MVSIAQIKQRFPAVKVIILSMHNTSSYIIRAFRSGARGYVLKNDDISAVIAAIHAVVEGKRFLSAQVSSETIDTYLRNTPDETDLVGQLTRREREVLQYAAEGLANTEIAEKLFLSPRTTETHRTNLMRKLNLQTQTDLVRFAIRKGLIQA